MPLIFIALFGCIAHAHTPQHSRIERFHGHHCEHAHNHALIKNHNVHWINGHYNLNGIWIRGHWSGRANFKHRRHI